MHRPHSIAHCQELKWSHRSQLRGPEQKHRDENVTKNILSPSQDTSHHHLSSAANLAVQDTIGTHGNIGGSVYQEALLCCCRWWSTGTECPEKLWSLLPGSLKAPGCGHEPPTLGVPAWAGGGAGRPRGPCQPQPFCHSVTHLERSCLKIPPVCYAVAGKLNISSSSLLYSHTREPVLGDLIWFTELAGQWPNSFCYTHLVLWASVSGRVMETAQILFMKRKEKCILVQAVSEALSKQNTLQYNAPKRSPQSFHFGKINNSSRSWLRNNTILMGILLFLAEYRWPSLAESFLGCTV